jgi:hypothetical protein
MQGRLGRHRAIRLLLLLLLLLLGDQLLDELALLYQQISD